MITKLIGLYTTSKSVDIREDIIRTLSRISECSFAIVRNMIGADFLLHADFILRDETKPKNLGDVFVILANLIDPDTTHYERSNEKSIITKNETESQTQMVIAAVLELSNICKVIRAASSFDLSQPKTDETNKTNKTEADFQSFQEEIHELFFVLLGRINEPNLKHFLKIQGAVHMLQRTLEFAMTREESTQNTFIRYLSKFSQLRHFMATFLVTVSMCEVAQASNIGLVLAYVIT
jgi:hypothetical protein